MKNFKTISSIDSKIDPSVGDGEKRNEIIIISDIHLGADLAYAECNKNLAQLEKFLEGVRINPSIKELVIAGDLLDEWYVPADIDTYQGKGQADFVKRIAETNKGVIDALNNIITDKNILVTYVPGNHDLTITRANVERILPRIHQVRDQNQFSLGTYSPKDCPKIAIEHGHRYNFFCAPDQFSNQEIAPRTILPPGYFYTRIAALCIAQHRPAPGDTPPVVTKNTLEPSTSQDLLYLYWNSWNKTLRQYTIKNKFTEKIIKTNINGFVGNYSVNDVLPFQTTKGGLIDVNFYKGIQDKWGERQTANNVKVKINVDHAILNASETKETDDQAIRQYFWNRRVDIRIVVFGHTHVPKIIPFGMGNNKSIYANSGTWIDDNALDPLTMTFVSIIPQDNDRLSSQTVVRLYSFKDGVKTQIAKDSIRY